MGSRMSSEMGFTIWEQNWKYAFTYLQNWQKWAPKLTFKLDKTCKKLNCCYTYPQYSSTKCVLYRQNQQNWGTSHSKSMQVKGKLHQSSKCKRVVTKSKSFANLWRKSRHEGPNCLILMRSTHDGRELYSRNPLHHLHNGLRQITFKPDLKDATQKSSNMCKDPCTFTFCLMSQGNQNTHKPKKA